MKNKIKQEKKALEVDAKGSLGLLAFGDIGLRAWRDAKENVKNISNEKK